MNYTLALATFIMAAAAITKGIQTAVNVAPYIIDGVNLAADLIGKHKDRISQMRELDNQIAETEGKINVLKAWFQQNNIDLPKSGSGILQDIHKFLDNMSTKWADYKIAGKAKRSAELTAYLMLLQKQKQLLEKKGMQGGGMAMRHRLRGGSAANGQELIAVVDLAPGQGGEGPIGDKLLHAASFIPGIGGYVNMASSLARRGPPRSRGVVVGAGSLNRGVALQNNMPGYTAAMYM